MRPGGVCIHCGTESEAVPLATYKASVCCPMKWTGTLDNPDGEAEIVEGSKQNTVCRAVTTSGIALHTGNRVTLTLQPAPVDSGVRFKRVDLPGMPEVRALVQNVVGTQRGTTISQGDAKVHTVEHVLATLNAMGIDNVMIEMSGPEPPIMDGSSKPFVEMLERAGTQEQDAARQFLEVKDKIFLEFGETKVMIVPDPEFRISCTVKYGATPLDCQYLSLSVTAASFVNELCEARTFCLYQEIEPLMALNLIGGGSLDNAVVIKDDLILSKEGLRYPDELVRHKMLDIVGDLYLLGRRLRGHVIAIKPGHSSNVALAREINTLMGDAS